MLRNLILVHSVILRVKDRGTSVLRPSLEDFLRFCQSTGRRVYLLSSKAKEGSPESSLPPEFTHLVEQTDPVTKATRSSVAELLGTYGLSPDETALIVDRPEDAETARASGVMVIALASESPSPREPNRTEAEVSVSNLRQLQKLLEPVGPHDEIRIEELELMARVGVPEEERNEPQRLVISLTLEPKEDFAALGDELARTIDYAEVCSEIRRFAAARQVRLIETLAQEIAAHLLQRFPLAGVELELRKFILPETRFVAVRLARRG